MRNPSVRFETHQRNTEEKQAKCKEEEERDEAPDESARAPAVTLTVVAPAQEQQQCRGADNSGGQPKHQSSDDGRA